MDKQKISVIWAESPLRERVVIAVVVWSTFFGFLLLLWWLKRGSY